MVRVDFIRRLRARVEGGELQPLDGFPHPGGGEGVDCRVPLITWETVVLETPACSATSFMVAIGLSLQIQDKVLLEKAQVVAKLVRWVPPIPSPLKKGRQIVFVRPHSVVQNQLLGVLIRNEFAVAVLNDHTKVRHLFRVYPDCISFLNIDEGYSEPQWEALVRETNEDPATAGVGAGHRQLQRQPPVVAQVPARPDGQLRGSSN